MGQIVLIGWIEMITAQPLEVGISWSYVLISIPPCKISRLVFIAGEIGEKKTAEYAYICFIKKYDMIKNSTVTFLLSCLPHSVSTQLVYRSSVAALFHTAIRDKQSDCDNVNTAKYDIVQIWRRNRSQQCPSAAPVRSPADYRNRGPWIQGSPLLLEDSETENGEEMCQWRSLETTGTPPALAVMDDGSWPRWQHGERHRESRHWKTWGERQPPARRKWGYSSWYRAEPVVM